jgi:hypothetical protein
MFQVFNIFPNNIAFDKQLKFNIFLVSVSAM